MPNSSHRRRRQFVHWRPILAIVVLITLGCLSYTEHLPYLVPGIYLVMSFVATWLYGLDKYKAKRGQWRIPESTLLLVDLACGWPGGLLGQGLWCHKNQKISYQFRFWIVVLINLIGLLLWAWLGHLQP